MAIYTTFSNSPEIGFGSVTTSPQADICDMGFGAPEFIEYDFSGDTFRFRNQLEMGHGDPFETIEIVIVEREDQDKLSDHGGELIKLFGRFDLLYETLRIPVPQEQQPIGPFVFKFVGKDAATLGLEYLCYSGLPGFGTKCYTDSSQKNMVFCTPSMLKGTYDLVISYGPINFTYPTAFEVIHRIRNDKTMSIRKSLPAWLDRGDTIDAIESGIQYKKGSESNIAILTDSFGQSLNNIYDNNYTVVTGEWRTGDTILNVETTLTFPKSGELRVGGQYTFKYNGKNNTSFLNVEVVGDQADIIRPDNRVYQTHSDFSKVENFWKIKNNQFYKPSRNITTESYESAFQIIEYGERPSEQVIFAYFYQLFKHLNYVKDVNISGNIISAPNDGTTWNCSHAGRVCRIEDTFYYINGENISVDGTLKLDDIGCTYWNGTRIQGENGFEANERTIEILPWIIERDSDGIFTIVFEKSVFNTKQGYIDKDYVDFNIYFDDGTGDLREGSNNNMNVNMLKAAGVIDTIFLRKRCDANFGTYINQEAAPDGLFIEPIRTFL
jgi:hypothetical protein